MLENNQEASAVLDMIELSKPAFFRSMGSGLVVGSVAVDYWPCSLFWLTVGLYDPLVRESVGYRWLRSDEWLHRRFGSFVRLSLRVGAAPVVEASVGQRRLGSCDWARAR